MPACHNIVITSLVGKNERLTVFMHFFTTVIVNNNIYKDLFIVILIRERIELTHEIDREEYYN